MRGSAAVAHSSQTQKIPNYLAQSVLVTLFCCLPFGIVSIIHAAQVNGKIQAQDIEGALESSRKAKFWSLLSFWLGLVFVLIYVALGAVGALGEVAAAK